MGKIGTENKREGINLKSTILKTIVAGSLALTCLGAVGCSGSDNEGYTGGVAATVNGVEIPEDKVTKDVQTYREQQNVTTEKAWGEWLAQYNYTPQTVREELLDPLIEQEVLRQEASEMGIAVEESEIDGYVQKMRDNYESDEAWQEALDQVGMTEEEYREKIDIELLKRGVQDKLAEETEGMTDAVSYFNEHVSEFQNLRRSSHILFKEGDEATAQDVLNRINSGELSFEDAASQYSTDTGSASQQGDVGYGAPINSFITEYTDALATLDEGQVSGLVPSQYGIHIIKCTEVYNPPASVESIDELPTEIVEYVNTQVESANESAYDEWMKSSRDEREIVINDMPENVPYNLDMSKYQDEETTEAENAEGVAEQEEFAEDLGTEEGAVDAVNEVNELEQAAEEGAQQAENSQGIEGAEGADGNAGADGGENAQG